MNTRLDQIAQIASAADAGGSPAPTRRARPAYRGTVAPSDLDRAKARAALRRLGLLP